jgi:arylsulfatase
MMEVKSKPNVLILQCDQMQAKRMGFVDGIADTPNLDALAKEGIHFPNAITIHGQCVPSRCAFFTGMSPHECQVMVNYPFHNHCGHLTTENRTFFQEFQENGYTTAHFGKSHIGYPLRKMGFDVGECIDGTFPEGKEPKERIEAREEFIKRDDDGYLDRTKELSIHYKALRDGIPWLKSHDPEDGPLLYMFDTDLPHPPFYYEKEWEEKFRPEDMILPESYYKETWEGKPPFLKEHCEAGPHAIKSEGHLREEMAQYYTLISEMDRACGEIIDIFKEKGMWENTIVLFFTDHGDMMGGHQLARKGTMPYEELYNIPCIMKLPQGIERNRSVVDDLIISTDFGGALLELAGLKAPGAFSNSDVVQAIKRDEAPEDEHVFFEHYAAWYGIHPFYAIRTKTMKYVRWYGKENFEELYDLESDPHELTNLVKDPSREEAYKKLSKMADEWWQSTGGKDLDYYESEAFKDNMNAV